MFDRQEVVSGLYRIVCNLGRNKMGVIWRRGRREYLHFPPAVPAGFAGASRCLG